MTAQSKKDLKNVAGMVQIVMFCPSVIRHLSMHFGYGATVAFFYHILSSSSVGGVLLWFCNVPFTRILQ